MNNPFSKDYVPQLKIDHKDRKYKRPVLNQPLNDVHQTLQPKSSVTLTERFTRISKTKI